MPCFIWSILIWSLGFVGYFRLENAADRYLGEVLVAATDLDAADEIREKFGEVFFDLMSQVVGGTAAIIFLSLVGLAIPPLGFLVVIAAVTRGLPLLWRFFQAVVLLVCLLLLVLVRFFAAAVLRIAGERRAIFATLSLILGAVPLALCA